MEFTIVKGAKVPDRVHPRTKSANTKYERLITYMKRLEVGDHIIFAQSYPEIKVRQKISNMKHTIKVHLNNRLIGRKFEYKGIPAAIHGRSGYDIIIRRVL